MKSIPLRWTSGLLLALSLLAGMAAWSRGRPEPRATSALQRPKPTEPEPEAPEVPQAQERSTPPREAPTPGPIPPVAWTNGYREAAEAGGEGTLSGRVVTPEGPMAGGVVTVEWVMAFHPSPEDARRLRRGGARRDRDGVWWWKARAVTDETGFFSIDGLPAVQLKVSAGGQAQSARPGQTVLLRTGTF